MATENSQISHPEESLINGKTNPPSSTTSASDLPPQDPSNPSLSQDEQLADDDAVINSFTTIFDDPKNFNAKHPLQNRWTIWFDNPAKRTNLHNWSNNLKNLITVDAVEDFWGVYNNVVKASSLAHGSNYHIFKEGIQPMWEDPQNANGGKWVIQVPKSKRGDLDQMWLHSILAVIGETFPDSDEICGIVVSSRKSADRLSLWTKTALSADEVIRCGQHWKQVLGMGEGDKIGYQVHSDALRKNSSFSNQDMYSV
ncbi:translation initiation factor eIF 4e-like domain-containing protein [Phlyctochytrium arcticum]|nr:translation initiation factor eIF 4e-like domain-containing protein [Phlyctochytrium arcticum]